MRTIDLPTLLLILAAGIELGLQGWFGFSFIGWLLGSWKIVAYEVIGVATLWQLCRQHA
jgi:uncharacterized membrane protein YuzA (DUF378 family)